MFFLQEALPSAPFKDPPRYSSPLDSPPHHSHPQVARLPPDSQPIYSQLENIRPPDRTKLQNQSQYSFSQHARRTPASTSEVNNFQPVHGNHTITNNSQSDPLNTPSHSTLSTAPDCTAVVNVQPTWSTPDDCTAVVNYQSTDDDTACKNYQPELEFDSRSLKSPHGLDVFRRFDGSPPPSYSGDETRQKKRRRKKKKRGPKDMPSEER